MINYSIFFENFSNWIEINYYFSIFIFIVFIILYSTFSLPGLLLFWVFGGFVFGVIISFLLCLISSTIGCFCFFILSKYFLNIFFKKKYKKYVSKIDDFIEDSSLEYLIILRLIIGPPLMIQNLILSFLEISSFKFILSTFIGLLPMVLFSTLIGNKLNDLSSVNSITFKNIFTLDLLLILLSFILIILARIYFKKKKTN